MKKLTHKELIRQLEYNSLTGIFRWKVANKYARIKIGTIAGTKSTNGYIIIGINGKTYPAHRLAYFHYYGYMPELEIDHKDRIRHHNWIDNLREVSFQCQKRNQKVYKNNKSKIKGVSWCKFVHKWVVHIGINRKKKSLGAYKDFDEAVCSRLAGEQCLNWSECDLNSSAYLYVKKNIQW